MRCTSTHPSYRFGYSSRRVASSDGTPCRRNKGTTSILEDHGGARHSTLTKLPWFALSEHNSRLVHQSRRSRQAVLERVDALHRGLPPPHAAANTARARAWPGREHPRKLIDQQYRDRFIFAGLQPGVYSKWLESGVIVEDQHPRRTGPPKTGPLPTPPRPSTSGIRDFAGVNRELQAQRPAAPPDRY